jgi:hypothetical protein
MLDPFRPRIVVAPDGSQLTIADLPPPGTQERWVCRHKALVVAAVRCGLLSLGDACNRYSLTIDEFLSWQSAINQHGLAPDYAPHIPRNIDRNGSAGICSAERAPVRCDSASALASVSHNK